jgi:exodeoxyribonuclease III
MKIATWNVNGVRARYAQLCEWVGRDKPDVICLQEIKATPDQIPAMASELDKYWCCWHGGKGYSGVSLHVRKEICPTEPAYFHPSFDLENRIVALTFDGMTVASVYVPNGGRDLSVKMDFIRALDQWTVETHQSGSSVVICGDLNVTRSDIDVHPKERKPNAIAQLPEERELLEALLARGLVDSTRALDPDNDGLFTWWAPWRNLRQRNIGWRLDYILVSESLFERVTSSKVLPEVGTSDHAPVMAVLREE